MEILSSDQQRELVRKNKKRAARTLFKILDNGDIFINGVFYGTFTTGFVILSYGLNPFISFVLWLVSAVVWLFKQKQGKGEIVKKMQRDQPSNLDSILDFAAAAYLGYASYLGLTGDYLQCSVDLVTFLIILFVKQKLPEGPFKKWLRDAKRQDYQRTM